LSAASRRDCELANQARNPTDLAGCRVLAA